MIGILRRWKSIHRVVSPTLRLVNSRLPTSALRFVSTQVIEAQPSRASELSLDAAATATKSIWSTALSNMMTQADSNHIVGQAVLKALNKREWDNVVLALDVCSLNKYALPPRVLTTIFVEAVEWSEWQTANAVFPLVVAHKEHVPTASVVSYLAGALSNPNGYLHILNHITTVLDHGRERLVGQVWFQKTREIAQTISPNNDLHRKSELTIEGTTPALLRTMEAWLRRCRNGEACSLPILRFILEYAIHVHLDALASEFARKALKACLKQELAQMADQNRETSFSRTFRTHEMLHTIGLTMAIRDRYLNDELSPNMPRFLHQPPPYSLNSQLPPQPIEAPKSIFGSPLPREYPKMLFELLVFWAELNKSIPVSQLDPRTMNQHFDTFFILEYLLRGASWVEPSTNKVLTAEQFEAANRVIKEQYDTATFFLRDDSQVDTMEFDVNSSYERRNLMYMCEQLGLALDFKLTNTSIDNNSTSGEVTLRRPSLSSPMLDADSKIKSLEQMLRHDILCEGSTHQERQKHLSNLRFLSKPVLWPEFTATFASEVGKRIRKQAASYILTGMASFSNVPAALMLLEQLLDLHEREKKQSAPSYSSVHHSSSSGDSGGPLSQKWTAVLFTICERARDLHGLVEVVRLLQQPRSEITLTNDDWNRIAEAAYACAKSFRASTTRRQAILLLLDMRRQQFKRNQQHQPQQHKQAHTIQSPSYVASPLGSKDNMRPVSDWTEGFSFTTIKKLLRMMLYVDQDVRAAAPFAMPLLRRQLQINATVPTTFRSRYVTRPPPPAVSYNNFGNRTSRNDEFEDVEYESNGRTRGRGTPEDLLSTVDQVEMVAMCKILMLMANPVDFETAAAASHSRSERILKLNKGLSHHNTGQSKYSRSNRRLEEGLYESVEEEDLPWTKEEEHLRNRRITLRARPFINRDFLKVTMEDTHMICRNFAAVIGAEGTERSVLVRRDVSALMGESSLPDTINRAGVIHAVNTSTARFIATKNALTTTEQREAVTEMGLLVCQMASRTNRFADGLELGMRILQILQHKP